MTQKEIPPGMRQRQAAPAAMSINVDALDSPLARLKLEIQAAAAAEHDRGSSGTMPPGDLASGLPSSSTRPPAASGPLVIDSFRHSFASISSFDSASSSATERTLDSDAGRGRYSEHEDAFASMVAKAAEAEREGQVSDGERDDRDGRSLRSTLRTARGHQKRDSSTSTIRKRLPGAAPAFHIEPPSHDSGGAFADDESTYSRESEDYAQVWDEADAVPEGPAQILPDRHSRPDFRRVSSSGFQSLRGDVGDVSEDRSVNIATTSADPRRDDTSTRAGNGSTDDRRRSSSRRAERGTARTHHSRPAPPPPPASTSDPSDGHFQPPRPSTLQPASQLDKSSHPSRELNALIISPTTTPARGQDSAVRPGLNRGNLSATSLASTASSLQEDAEAFLIKGIKLQADAHREGDLAESALMFKKAAERGSLGGAVFYGLALRHGWGIAKDEKKGFQWLHKACDQIVEDPARMSELQRQSQKLPRETIMALFEVGNCYLQGLGVKSDPALALSYFRCAAEMGDVEAQEHLGLLLSKGKQGIKKDLVEAAKWYRSAVAQGASNVGLAWAYKDKYINP